MLTTLFALYASAQINSNQLTSLPFEDTIPKRNVGIEILSLSPVPIKAKDVSIGLSSVSALVIDINSNKVLFEKNIDSKLPIASLTKIMTAVVTLETINSIYEVATVSENASNTLGSSIFLQNGEKITYKDLLYGAMIASGNDAAVTIAENVAGSVEGFVELMNAKAAELGMKNTHFANPHGLDDNEGYSTAEDLSILATYALKKPFIRSIIDIKNMEIESESGITHVLVNTNKLLGVDPEIRGLKTGTTLGAGECLIAVAVNPYGNEILTILLNSNARFQETQYLKDEIWDTYVW